MSANSDWRTDSWNVNLVEVDKLQEKMIQIPHLSEVVINKTLENKSEPQTTESIKQLFPISKRNPQLPITLESGKRATVGHIQNADSLKIMHENLGFTVRPKPNWRYIVYPDLGIGNANPLPQEFMRKGMERRIPAITKELEEALQEEVNKYLGGN
ncbi:hypothetical protein [Enterococcus sp. DIV1420a]|uniref:hypothetical protein n=1 Tax=Enterococcus TaxID=1350 RepID=UPI003F259948